MDSLITAAARALAAGDPLGALNRVTLRDDAPALALRGIAMARVPRVFTGEEGSAPLDLANAGSRPASTASSAGDQLQQRCRMEGAHQQVHRDHSAFG
jgi:hypothetical protein